MSTVAYREDAFFDYLCDVHITGDLDRWIPQDLANVALVQKFHWYQYDLELGYDIYETLERWCQLARKSALQSAFAQLAKSSSKRQEFEDGHFRNRNWESASSFDAANQYPEHVV